MATEAMSQRRSWCLGDRQSMKDRRVSWNEVKCKKTEATWVAVGSANRCQEDLFVKKCEDRFDWKIEAM